MIACRRPSLSSPKLFSSQFSAQIAGVHIEKSTCKRWSSASRTPESRIDKSAPRAPLDARQLPPRRQQFDDVGP